MWKRHYEQDQLESGFYAVELKTKLVDEDTNQCQQQKIVARICCYWDGHRWIAVSNNINVPLLVERDDLIIMYKRW